MKRRNFLGMTLSAGVAAALPSTAGAAGMLQSLTAVSSSIVGRTGAGDEVTIEKAALEELKGTLRGNLLRSYWSTIDKFTDGFYTNTGDFETQDSLNRNYRGNHKRLVALKDKYDPGNLFRLNANIQPSAKRRTSAGTIS